MNKDEKLLKEIQDNLKWAIEEDRENRQKALEDLEFIAKDGAQWPDDIKVQRLADKRPCLTINKMPAFISQVVGDQRMNRPSIKVVPVDSKGDIEVARILGGWIKHVYNISNGDIAVDHGFEHAVSCAYGAMRVVTKYCNNDNFDQDAFIEKIDNALSVYWGPHKEYDCSDAHWCLIISDIPRNEFKDKYKSEPMEFNPQNAQYVEGWCDKDSVRVAEYFKKVNQPKVIYELDSGEIVETVPENAVVLRKRNVDNYKIMWYLVSGSKVLESTEWVGKKYIPVVPIWGKELNIGGKRVVTSLIRNAKDVQRMYNYWESVDTEVVALQPRVPYMVTPKQIEGYESMWNNMTQKNWPYLLVNPDPKAPGWPHRESPPIASSAMLERIQNTDQQMRDTVGLQKAALGMQSNERSGKAIIERKKEGDVGTFVFIDNLTRSIKHLGRILVDVAPGILDTQRVIRMGLDDGVSQEFTTINEEVQLNENFVQTLKDPSVGTYDVVVTVGPSFTTQRSEARQSMSEFIQYYPQAAPLIGDLYAKAMDWNGAEDFAERLKFILPPEIRLQEETKKAIAEGKEPPAPPQPPPPSPTEVMEMKKLDLELKQKEIDLKEKDIVLKQEEIKLAQEKVKLAQMRGELMDEAGKRDQGIEKANSILEEMI